LVLEIPAFLRRQSILEILEYVDLLYHLQLVLDYLEDL